MEVKVMLLMKIGLGLSGNSWKQNESGDIFYNMFNLPCSKIRDQLQNLCQSVTLFFFSYQLHSCIFRLHVLGPTLLHIELRFSMMLMHIMLNHKHANSF